MLFLPSPRCGMGGQQRLPHRGAGLSRGAGGMFTYVGGFTARHPWLVCAGWLALALALTLIAPSWDRRACDDDIRFLPSRCPSVRGYALLEQAFPHEVYASRLVFA